MLDIAEHQAALTEDSAPFTTVLAKAIFRQRKIGLSIAILVFMLVGVVVAIMPRKYKAEAEVLVGDERPSLPITASANASAHSYQGVDETQVNSELQLMTSLGLINTVAADILSKASSASTSATAVHSPLTVEKEAKKLENHLEVEAVRKSDVIKLSYSDRDPDRARTVLQEILATYLSAHLQAHANPGSYDFFSNEATKYRQRLDTVESQLTALESHEDVVDLPLQEETLTKSREDIETALLNSESMIASEERSLLVGDDSLRSLSPRIPTESTSTPNQYSIERLRTMLVELTNKRTALLANFLPNDRQVVELDQEILTTSKTLALAEDNQSVANATNINPVHQAIETDVTRLKMQLASERARHATLQKASQIYDLRIAHLALIQQQEQRLLRQQKEDRDNYALYAQKQEEARVSQSLDRERFSNVSVIEAPLASYVPFQPKVALDLFLGFFLANFLAISGSLLYDRKEMKRSISLNQIPTNLNQDRRTK